MRRTKSDVAEQVVQSAYEGTIRKTNCIYTDKDLIPTGSTLLNLALSDSNIGGWLKGSMVNIIGDSSAGKSFVALSTLAEVSIKNECKDYSLIYDDIENANSFNMSYLFGASFEKRLLSPYINENGESIPSDMIEDFQMNLVNALENGPCVYCVDSFDALNAEADEKKSIEILEDRQKGKKFKGTYGMAKAKKSSEILRQVVSRIKRTNSLLLIISQTRDNVDPMSPQKRTRAGGRALKFYASHEVWLHNGGMIKSKGRVIGVKCKVKISKNKLTGKIREVTFPIYYDYGIDDISSCIEFLIEQEHWEGGGTKKINAEELGIEPCTQAKLVRQIERQKLEQRVSSIVGQVWHDLEESVRLKRKPKYGGL